MSSSRKPPSKRDAKREEIIGQALMEFCLFGIEGAAMAEIASKSGITRRTLYTYYPDKEALADDVYIKNLGNLFGRLATLMRKEGDIRDLISGSLKAYLETRRTHPEFIYYDYIYHTYCAAKKKNPQATLAYSQALNELNPDGMEPSAKAARTLHLYFCYLQKSVLLSVQGGDLFSTKMDTEDQAMLDYLIECAKMIG
jgi:AcrR family transcriptional regulator